MVKLGPRGQLAAARHQGGSHRDHAEHPPFFAYTGRVFFLRLGLLMPLDDPLGFAFERGKVLSPHLTLGGQW